MARHFQALDFTSQFTEKGRKWRSHQVTAKKQKVNPVSAVAQIPLHTSVVSEVVVSPNFAPASAQSKSPTSLFKVMQSNRLGQKFERI